MKNILVYIIFSFLCHLSSAQEISHFSINSDNVGRKDVSMCISLEGLNYNTDNGNLSLVEKTIDGEQEIPCQLESGHSAKLWFILPENADNTELRNFVLKIDKNKPIDSQKTSTILISKNDKDLSLLHKNSPILKYRFGVSNPPEGIDPLYKRSGYIHPLYSPEGEVLTRIQPSDHYHHYGIWGPWTKTHIDEREVDFWNLIKGHGTVKYASFLSEFKGPVFTGFKALQHHIDFAGKGESQIAMNEILDVRVWNSEGKVRIVDYTSSINCPLPNGIMLDAYRYGGGIGFRATDKWHKDNCTVLTSENKTRKDADGTSARWCIVEGESETVSGRSGILFMSHPSNRMHPEPMRVWPLDANKGRGDMFFEFCPIRHEGWKIEPKQSYTLKYRMVIFDGEITAEDAEKYWQAFANPPYVTITNIIK